MFSGFFRVVFILASLTLALAFLYNEWRLIEFNIYLLADPSRQLEVFTQLLSNPIAWILFLVAFISFFIGERLEPKI